MEIFGHNLRRLRLKKRLSTYELWRRSGCSQPYISQLENGRSAPSLDIAMRLADALGCDINDFLKPIESEGR